MTLMTESEAALEEGYAPMPEDLKVDRERRLAIKQEIEQLEGEYAEIRERFLQRMDQDGVRGYLLNGKVHARIKTVVRQTVDSKALKTKMPHIWKQFVKTSETRSVNID